ncbi:MAG: quercetin 2,3-dioxygenase [Candidatus Dormiibacterota bacterium]
MSLPTTTTGYALQPDEGEALWFNGTLVIVKASAEQTEGRYGAVEFRGNKGFAAPLHIHRHDDELFIVLAGKVRFQLADEVIEGVAGSMVYGPRTVPHSFRLDSDDARVLLIFGPAGTEGFFREAGKPARSFGLPPADEQFIDRDMLMKIGNSHDQEFVGPPLPPKS